MADQIHSKTIIISFTLALCLSVSTGLAKEADSSLNVYAGYCIFGDPVYDSVSLLEISFSLKRDEFEFFQADSADTFLSARVYAHVNLFSPQGKAVDSAGTYFALRVNSTAEAELLDIRIFNNLSLFVHPGVYSARLTVYDVYSKSRGEFFFDQFEVLPVEKNNISIGGLCLAYNIAFVGEAETNSRLVKNGYRIYPNPIAIFSTDDSVLFFYSEVYNLPPVDTAGDLFEINYVLLNRDSAWLRDLGSRSGSTGDGTGVIVESFDIKGWHPAVYNLQVIASYRSSGLADTAVVPFGIISPVGFGGSFRAAASDDPYQKMSLEERVNLVAYLLTPEQKIILNMLTDSGKTNFLNQYWREHDSNPVTAINEERLEMIKRFEYANLRFSLNDAKTDGWLTDRGRIYMTYGVWDELDDISSPRIGNPYLVWYYRGLDEGKMFVFEDWAGTYDYRLVHSNVYGEVFDQRWDNFLTKGLQLDIE